MGEILILQQTEFQIIAVAVKFLQVYGIRTDIIVDEKSFMYNLHEMVVKGIFCVRDQEFVLQEPYRTAFLSMRDAESILSVSGNRDVLGNICFYIGDKLITLEQSIQDESALRIGIYEKSELSGLLEEKGFFPEPFVESDIAQFQSEEEIVDTLSDSVKKQLFDSKGITFIQAESTQDENISTEGEIYAQYLIFEPKKGTQAKRAYYLLYNPYNYWIAEKDDNDINFFYYTMNSLDERLKQSLFKR